MPHGRRGGADGQARLIFEFLHEFVPSGIPGGIFRFGQAQMTNQIAIILGSVILIGLGLDWYLNDQTGTLYLGRKLADLIEWLAFWR